MVRLFQSHNGAIAASVNRPSCWQPVQVSIPQWCDCCVTEDLTQLVEDYCFNPTMVRLLPSPPSRISEDLQVSIPQWCDCCSFLQGHRRLPCFNPTMVRLLPSGTDRSTNRLVKVSIPQWCDCCINCIRLLEQSQYCFNPTMVRLLRSNDCPERNVDSVSIPQWCDCCATKEGD